MRHWSIATVSTLVPGLYEQVHCSNPLTPLLIMVLHACLPEVWSCFWLLSFSCVFNMRTHPFLAPKKHRRIRVIEGLWVMVQMVVGEQRSNREWGQLLMLVFAKYGPLHRFFFFSFFFFFSWLSRLLYARFRKRVSFSTRLWTPRHPSLTKRSCCGRLYWFEFTLLQ